MKKTIKLARVVLLTLISSYATLNGMAPQVEVKTRNQVTSLLNSAATKANAANQGFERIERAWQDLDQARQALDKLKAAGRDIRDLQLDLCRRECEIALRYLGSMFGRYPATGFTVRNGARVGGANTPQTVSSNPREIVRDITYDIARLFDEITGNGIASRAPIQGESEHSSVSGRHGSPAIYRTEWMQDTLENLRNTVQTLTGAGAKGAAPGNLQAIFTAVGGNVNTAQAAAKTLNDLVTLVGRNSRDVTGAIITIQSIIQTLDATGNSATLYDALDELDNLFNFMGGTPAGITSADVAVRALNQWLGDPIGGNYDPATRQYVNGGSNFDPANQTFDLQSSVLPVWSTIKSLLLKPGQTANFEAVNNFNDLMKLIFPAPATGRRQYNEFILPINTLRDLGGSTSAAGSVTAAPSLYDAMQNLTNAANQIYGDLGQGNYVAGTAIDLSVLAGQLTEVLNDDIKAFLTDRTGAPQNQTAAANKVQNFQQNVDVFFPGEQVGDNLTSLLNKLQTGAQLRNRMNKWKAQLRATGYAQGSPSAVAGDPLIQEILNYIVAFS